MPPDLIDKLRLELRRGTLTVAVLAQLRAELEHRVGPDDTGSGGAS